MPQIPFRLRQRFVELTTIPRQCVLSDLSSTNMIKAGHNFSILTLDNIAVLHHTRGVVRAPSINALVFASRPSLQNIPAMMRIRIVRRHRGCVIRSNILLGHPIQPSRANAPLSAMMPLVVAILHGMDLDGNCVLFPNCVRPKG